MGLVWNLATLQCCRPQWSFNLCFLEPISALTRVTRLGEFSPLGQLFSYILHFLKLKMQTNVWGHLFPREKLCVGFIRKQVGLHSGHPDPYQPTHFCLLCTFSARFYQVWPIPFLSGHYGFLPIITGQPVLPFLPVLAHTILPNLVHLSPF
jgi:hypothetical protein